MKTTKVIAKDIKRFFDKVRFDNKNGCWNWDGSFSIEMGKSGYQVPRFHLNGFGNIYAKRFSYQILLGKPPEKIYSTCGNDKCVNPLHLGPTPCRDKKTGKVFKQPSREWVSLTPKLVKQIVTLHKLGRTLAQIQEKTGAGIMAIVNSIKIAEMCRNGELS